MHLGLDFYVHVYVQRYGPYLYRLPIDASMCTCIDALGGVLSETAKSNACRNCWSLGHPRALNFQNEG